MHVLELACIHVGELAIREWREDDVFRGLQNCCAHSGFSLCQK
jgi:hypothetical protein